MTVREKIELEMDQEEIKELEEENANNSEIGRASCRERVSSVV